MAEKILIIDDDLDTLKLVGLILQRQGYEIVAANSGSQGLAKAAAERPNLVLLDVMMPDMEGYEVARRLRADPELARTPIIMFTAKTMVDDKVAGFEAGVDDYMTKPTHPAELVSRVKALLARSATHQTTTPAATSATGALDRGRLVGLLGAKGGLGVTTLAINLAVAMTQTGQDVIVCELRPGQGSLSLQLGLPPSHAVGGLLSKPAADINPRSIEGYLTAHSSGARLLLSAYDPNEMALERNTEQALQLVRQLATMTKFLILDLSPNLTEINKKVLSVCDRPIMIVEPMRVTLTIAKAILDELEKIGIPANRFEIVMINKVRSSLQMPWQQAEAMLNHSIASIITPAPELAHQAAESATPMIQIQADSQTAEQTRKLVELLTQKGRPGK